MKRCRLLVMDFCCHLLEYRRADDVTAWCDSRAWSEFIVQVSLLGKVFQNLQRKQQEKISLIINLHRGTIRRIPYKVDSDWFEKYLSKAASVCPMLEQFEGYGKSMNGSLTPLNTYLKLKLAEYKWNKSQFLLLTFHFSFVLRILKSV